MTRGLQGVPTDGPAVVDGDLGAPSLPQDWSGGEGLRDFSHFSADAYGVGLRADLNAGQESFASQPEHWSPGGGLFAEQPELSDPFDAAWQQPSSVLSESSSAYVHAHPSSDAFDGLPDPALELEAGEADEIFEDYSEADLAPDAQEPPPPGADEGVDQTSAEGAFSSAQPTEDLDAFAAPSEPAPLASARPTSTSSGAALPFAYDSDATSDSARTEPSDDSLDDDEVFDDTRTTLSPYGDAPREADTDFQDDFPQAPRPSTLLASPGQGADLPFSPDGPSADPDWGTASWTPPGPPPENAPLENAFPEDEEALALPPSERASLDASDDVSLEDATQNPPPSEPDPALEEAALEEAAIEEATPEEAALEEAAIEEAVIEEAAIEEAALEEAALEEAALEEAPSAPPSEPDPVMEEAALEEAALEEATIDEAPSAPPSEPDPVIEEAALEEATLEEAAIEEPPPALSEAPSDAAVDSEIPLGEAESEERSWQDRPPYVDPEPSVELELTGELLPLEEAAALGAEAEALQAEPSSPPAEEPSMQDSPKDTLTPSPLIGLEVVRSELDQLLGGMGPMEGTTSRPLEPTFPFRSGGDSDASIEIDAGDDPAELMPPASIEAADPDELPEPPAEADALMLPEVDPPADVGWDRASVGQEPSALPLASAAKPGSSETTTELRMTSWSDVRALNTSTTLEPPQAEAAQAEPESTRSETATPALPTHLNEAPSSPEQATAMEPEESLEAVDAGEEADVLTEDAGADEPGVALTLEAPTLLSETAARFLLRPTTPLQPSEPLPSVEARLDSAIRILREEARLAEPEQQAAWGLEVASLLVERGDREAAQAQLQACVEAVPDFVPAFRGLAALAGEAGQYEAQADWTSKRSFAEPSPEGQAAVLFAAASLRLTHGLETNETLRLLEGANELLGPQVELLETLANLQEAVALTAGDTQKALEHKALETWRSLASAAAPLTGQALVAGKAQRARALTQAARLALKTHDDLPQARALLHEALEANAAYAPARIEEMRLTETHAGPTTRLELLVKTLAHREGPIGLVQALEAVSLASRQALPDGDVVEQAALQRALEVGAQDAAPLHPLWLELLGARLRTGAWQESVGQLRETQAHLQTPEAQALLQFALALLCEHPLRESALAASRLEEALSLIQHLPSKPAASDTSAEAGTRGERSEEESQAERTAAPWRVARERLQQLNLRCGQIGSVAAGLVEEAEQSSHPVVAAARLFQAARLYRDALGDATQARTCLCRALDLDPHPLYALALRRSLLESPPHAPEALIALAELTASVLAQTLDPAQAPPPPEAVELEMHAARAEVQHPEIAWQLYEAALEQGSRAPMVLEGLRRLATTPESRALYLRQLEQLEEDTQNPRTRLIYLWEQLELLGAPGRKGTADIGGDKRAGSTGGNARTTGSGSRTTAEISASTVDSLRLYSVRSRILAITESLPLLEDQRDATPAGAEADALRQRIQGVTGAAQEHPLDRLALQLQALVEGLVHAVSDPVSARSQNARLLALPVLEGTDASSSLEAARPVFALFQSLLRSVTRDIPAQVQALRQQLDEAPASIHADFLRLRLACWSAFGGGVAPDHVEGLDLGPLLDLLESWIREGQAAPELLDLYEHLAAAAQRDVSPLFLEVAESLLRRLSEADAVREADADRPTLLLALQDVEMRAARRQETTGARDQALLHYAQVWERSSGTEDDPYLHSLTQEALAGVLRLSPTADANLAATAFTFLAEHSLDPLDRARGAWRAGLAWETLGEPDKAEVWWSRAMRHAFYREAAGRKLLELYRNAGSVRGVTSLYEPLIHEEQRPLRRLGLEMDLADQLEGFGALPYAVTHFERLSRKDHYLPACLRLERIHLASEDWSGYVLALEARAEAVTSEALQAETRQLIHQIKAERLRDPWALEQALQEELRHNPVNDTALDHLRSLLASQERWTDLALFLEALSGRPMEEARKARLLLDAAWIYAHQLGDLDVAWQRYQEVLDRIPGESEALTALKDLCERRQDWSGLVSVLARQAAGETGVVRLDLYRHIARVWDEKLKDPQTSLAAWEQVRLEAPDDPQVLQPMLELCRRLGRWELFVPLGEALLSARGEDDAVLLLELAATAIRQLSEPALGVGYIRRAFRLGAHAYDLLRQAAELHEARGEWRDASQLYLELGYEMQPTTPQLQALQVESLQRLALLARDHLADPLLAARSWIEVLQRVPDHLSVMWLLAQLYFEHNQHEDARETLHRLIRHPAAANYLDALSVEERLRFHRLMGRLQDEAGDHPAAIAHLEVALQLSPDDPAVQSALAGLYRATGSWDRYIALLRTLIQTTPESMTELLIHRYEALAEACHAHGLDDDALSACQSVRTLQPNRISAYRLASQILVAREAWTVLLELYNGLIKHGAEVADVVEAYLRKADILGDKLATSDSSRLPKAVLHYEKALQYDRRSAYAMLRLAEISLRTLQYQKADDWLRRVLAVDPSPHLQARMWFLGAIFAAEAQRSPEKALANMKRALEHAPELAQQQEAIEAALGRSPGNMEALLKAYRALLPVEALQQRT